MDRVAGGRAILDHRDSLRLPCLQHAQTPVSPLALLPATAGEIAVIGLGRSGAAASELLLARGYTVYACDDGTSPKLTDIATQLTMRGGTAQTGGHDASRIARAALVVVSPGVPPDAAPLVVARRAEREI